MVDRLRVSGDPVLTEDGAGDVTLDVEAVDTERLSTVGGTAKRTVTPIEEGSLNPSNGLTITIPETFDTVVFEAVIHDSDGGSAEQQATMRINGDSTLNYDTSRAIGAAQWEWYHIGQSQHGFVMLPGKWGTVDTVSSISATNTFLNADNRSWMEHTGPPSSPLTEISFPTMNKIEDMSYWAYAINWEAV